MHFYPTCCRYTEQPSLFVGDSLAKSVIVPILNFLFFNLISSSSLNLSSQVIYSRFLISFQKDMELFLRDFSDSSCFEIWCPKWIQHSSSIFTTAKQNWKINSCSLQAVLAYTLQYDCFFFAEAQLWLLLSLWSAVSPRLPCGVSHQEQLNMSAWM